MQGGEECGAGRCDAGGRAETLAGLQEPGGGAGFWQRYVRECLCPDSGPRVAASSVCGLACLQPGYLRAGGCHQFLVGVRVAVQAPAPVGCLGEQHPGPAG